MVPDTELLLEALELDTPVVGVYDAPPGPVFSPVVIPGSRGHQCLFAYYKKWRQGYTLQLSEGHHGCGGCGKWMFNVSNRSRMEYLDFLVDEEGLRASRELMGRWFDQSHPYQPEHGYLFIGPLKDDAYDHVQSITFFVNPDQLSVLITGAYYHSDPSDPAPVTAPFGSGCMLLMTLFADRNIPQAIIGATDMAMRRYVPPDVLAFTVTRGMYERLAQLDERSFLNKPFLEQLKKSRKNAKKK